MKKFIFCTAFTAICSLLVLSSCNKFPLQRNYDRSTTDTIDAHLNKTAWAYLKSRAYGSTKDTIFRRMYDAIIFSGIDTLEYTKPNRTFIFFTNAAVTTKTTGYWAAFLTAKKVAGKKWSDYAAADIKSHLQYLILLGQYSHYNLPISDIDITTLAPAGTYTNNTASFIIPGTFVSNPNSVIRMKVLDSSPSTSSDYPLVINGTYNVTTSDLLATNGVVQVIALPITPILP